jgi:poly-gamma-glutamate capsule biosynthesis protein CapA/YwtB (metallophosphatase superfamily)
MRRFHSWPLLVITLFAWAAVAWAAAVAVDASARPIVLSAKVTVTHPAPATPAEDDGTPHATLIAMGDIMLSRVVGQKLRQHGNAYAFEKMADELRKGDIVFANLETPITAGREITSGMSFRSDPGVEYAMKDAGITVLSLANNHTPNFGEKGIIDTVALLDKAGIAHAGAGKDLAAASAPAVVEAQGLTVAFLAYNDSDVVPASYGAAEKHAGTNIIDGKRVAGDIAAARKLADLVIVSMHSGTEYVLEPNARQKAFAHAAIDGGADLVIGHHPHVVQRAEVYKGKYVFYSLGNFVFDQMWSADTRRGLVLKIRLGEDGVENVSYLPVLIEDYARPRPLGGKDGEAVIKRLGL